MSVMYSICPWTNKLSFLKVLIVSFSTKRASTMNPPEEHFVEASEDFQ